MSLFSFEIIEVILRRFLCKESKRYSLISSNHFLWSISKRKGINFFFLQRCKKSFTFNEFFFIRRQLSDLFDLQRVYHLKNFMSIAFASPRHNENLWGNKEIFCQSYISFLKFFLIIVLQRKKTWQQIFATDNFYLESNFSSYCLLLLIISRTDMSLSSCIKVLSARCTFLNQGWIITYFVVVDLMGSRFLVQVIDLIVIRLFQLLIQNVRNHFTKVIVELTVSSLVTTII